MNVKTKGEVSQRFNYILNLRDGWKNSKGKAFHPIKKDIVCNAMSIAKDLLFIDEINCEFYNSVELHYKLKDNFVNFSIHSDYILITAYKDFLKTQDTYYPRYTKKLNLGLDLHQRQFIIDFLNACIIYYLVLRSVDIYNINPQFVLTEECKSIMHNHQCLAKINRKEEKIL